MTIAIDINNIGVGDRLKFADDGYWYTVHARNDKFIVCNAVTKRDTYHTTIDIDKGIRGADNLVFHQGYCNTVDCEERLIDFTNGEIEISKRNRVPLNIIKHKVERVLK